MVDLARLKASAISEGVIQGLLLRSNKKLMVPKAYKIAAAHVSMLPDSNGLGFFRQSAAIAFRRQTGSNLKDHF